MGSKIIIDVDELRNISTLSVESALKMDDANMKISTVVSQHDWKCPERVGIDDALETIKKNVADLSDTFNDFAAQITDIANEYTEFINSRSRMITSYAEDLASVISELGMDGVMTGHSIGGSIPVVADLANSSLDTANVAALHGSSEAINIMDFSLFSE